ncbi:dead end protein homolog 1 isoform X1 [Piliocolobus tephrosceles]|uniref:dead end protein homolog 1 isoform X1 n=1 Tax=Piliocolobus tephrosceles TaxID=591936 RepID=UPI000C29D188|nr:dead end protein homolog 1 isoform X1 [Piliocolobus tephrosceles]
MQSKRDCELWCERVNPENKAALEAWVRETGIRLVQVNGQRKYGGPPPGMVVPAPLPVWLHQPPLGEGPPRAVRNCKLPGFISSSKGGTVAPRPPAPSREGANLNHSVPAPSLAQSLNYASHPGYGCKPISQALVHIASHPRALGRWAQNSKASPDGGLAYPLPTGWVGSPPPAGSEVFIGRLPQDVYEHQLIPLFQRVGRLYEFRLMMTFSGLNRGFAYARYSSRRGAQAAIATLHNHPLRPSCPLLVCRSTEKCELSVDGLPLNLTRSALLLALQPLGPGLQEARLLPSPGPAPGQIALLKFSSHRAAAMAKKALVEGQSHLCGEQVAVEWLKPDLKQRLRQQLLGPSLRPPQPEGSQLALARDKLGSQGARATLQLLCQRMKLGSPVFLTKCLGIGPAGWHRFWYQVVIPGHPVPFSGLIWVVLTLDGQDGHEVAKDAVSVRLLQALSESGASLLWSAGAEAGTMVKQ